MPTKKWEYLHYSDGYDIAKLNALGEQGWELIGFVHNAYPVPIEDNDDPPLPDKCTFCFYFKREIK
jgi:hypothetical protein